MQPKKKAQEMCNEAVGIKPYKFGCVPDYLKMQEMRQNAVEKYPWLL